MSNENTESTNVSCGCGPIGLGPILAVLFSWFVNGSIGWAIVHFFLGWIYVVWSLIFHYDAVADGVSRILVVL